MANMMNEVGFEAPTHWVDYETIKPGEWFWTHNPDPKNPLAFPMMRVDGGYVSPANGHYAEDHLNPYKKVIPVPKGTVLRISVGTRI